MSTNYLSIKLGSPPKQKVQDEVEKSRQVQDHGKRGLSVREVAVMPKTAMTPETAKTVKTATVASLCCNL